MEESLLFVAGDRYSHARHFELGWSKMISTVAKYMNFAHRQNTLLSATSKKNHGMGLLYRLVATTVAIVIVKHYMNCLIRCINHSKWKMVTLSPRIDQSDSIQLPTGRIT